MDLNAGPISALFVAVLPLSTYDFRNSSGSLARLAAIRRGSSRMYAERGLIISLHNKAVGS